MLLLVACNLLFVFTNYIGYKQSTYLFIGLGILYFLASLFEAYSLSKTAEGALRFDYITDSFLTKRIIKVIIFICSGVILLVSASIIQYLAYLCFTIAATEIIITLIKYFGKWNYVSISEDWIAISTNKLITLRVNEINKVEFRHGLTYIVTQDKNAFTIRTDNMKQKAEFENELTNWCDKNKIISIKN